MLLKGCLHSGHSAFTLDHSSKHVKQNWWKQLSVKDLFSSLPKQITHPGSGEEGDLGLVSDLGLSSSWKVSCSSVLLLFSVSSIVNDSMPWPQSAALGVALHSSAFDDLTTVALDS